MEGDPKKTIGILGGLGPSAGLELYRLLIAKENEMGVWMDGDFNPVVLYSLAIPKQFWNEQGVVEGKESHVEGYLRFGVHQLEEAGVDAIVVACNTAHLFLASMREAVEIPVIDMVRETADVARKQGWRKVGVVGSGTTRRAKLYEDALRELGLDPVIAIDAEQEELDKVISMVMGGMKNVLMRRKADEIVRAMALRGAEVVIIGCTELPIAFGGDEMTRFDDGMVVPLISSSQCAVDAIFKIF